MYSIIPEEWPAVRAHLRARLAAHARMSVTALAIAPVKGMRVDAGRRARARRRPARDGDRAFFVVDPDDALLADHAHAAACCRSSRAGTARRSRLRFPDGTEVAEAPEPGAPRETATTPAGRSAGGCVDGPLAAAVSDAPRPPGALLARDAASAAPTTRRSR